MSFRLRAPLPLSLDVSGITPASLRDSTRNEIERLPLALGRRKFALTELFHFEGDNPSHIVFEGECEKLLRIGAGMMQGQITVEGNAGDELGVAMGGGTLVVRGHTGDQAGCEMRDGYIHIHGNTGDFLGGIQAGSKQGMRGGLIHVKGNAGDRAADHMRRGMILIEGGAGAYAGARMLAGTIFIKGAIGALPGFGLRRGSIVLSRRPGSVPEYFADCGTHDLSFLTLMGQSLRRRGGFEKFLPLPARAHRWCGDTSVGATGEILHLL